MVGPRLVIPGALVSSSALAIFLFLITAGMTFPTAAGSSLALPPAQSDASIPALSDLSAEQPAEAATSQPATPIGCGINDRFPPRFNSGAI